MAGHNQTYSNSEGCKVVSWTIKGGSFQRDLEDDDLLQLGLL